MKIIIVTILSKKDYEDKIMRIYVEANTFRAKHGKYLLIKQISITKY